MASPRQDRRTPARDAFGHVGVTFPLSDKGAPDIVNSKDLRTKQLPGAIGSTLPGFGTTHPDTVNYPNAYLINLLVSPGDVTDQNVKTRYVTLPGTLLTSKKTSQWGNVTTTDQANLAATKLIISGSTADASSTGDNAVESKISLTNYDTFPTPWLYSYPVDPETNIGTRVQKRLNVNGTLGSVTQPSGVAITNATVANPTIITLTSQIPVLGGTVMPLRSGELVTILGDTNATPSINGQWPATFIDSTHISIPVNVTSVAGSGFGSVAQAAFIYQEIEDLNDRECIEIWSQIDSSTLTGANKTWSEYIQYPWKEVVVGIDYFTDTGSSSTSASGTFPFPTTITYAYGGNTDVDVAIRTKRYTGKTFATITRTFSIGAPTPDTVLLIRTSSGEIVMEGSAQSTHVALSLSSSTTGSETSLSNSVHYKTARVEDVLTNGFVTGITIGGGVTLKMDASSPSTFTAGATFIASCDVSTGRLGLYMKETTVITVPTPFP